MFSDGETSSSGNVTRDGRGESYVGSGYYRRPKKEGSRVALNFKVSVALKASLQAVMKLWQLRAELEGATKDEVKDIDLTFVCNQLLEVGVDGAWEEVGAEAGLSGAPKNDAEWAKLRLALEAKRPAEK